jgi:hypothetical protein
VEVEDIYTDEFGKISLALTSAQIAKKDFVKEFGVGEDLAFNFIGWKDGRIAIILQLNKDFMKESPALRLGRCMDMCRIVKGFWDVDAISMVAEGYCSEDPGRTKGLDLQKAFIDPTHSVFECITVTHVEEDFDQELGVTLVSVPYSYNAGNIVEFDTVRVYPQGAVNVLRDKSYPAMLYKTISEAYPIDIDDEDEAIDKLVAMGFHVQVIY